MTAPSFDSDTEQYAEFTVEWTDGAEYYADTMEVDKLMFFGEYAASEWSFTVHDDYGGDPSTVWTAADSETPLACDADGLCAGDLCATRALVASGEFDLPFKDVTDFTAIFDLGDFEGMVNVYSGAMSLGLVILSTAGAALTLI